MARWRPAPGTGKWWALGIAFTLAFTAFATWRELSVASQAIDARTIGYSVVDDRSIVVTFEVTKPPETVVRCTIEAQDLKKNKVGTTSVDIPTAPGRVTAHEVTIRTTTRAFTGLVHDCVRS